MRTKYKAVSNENHGGVLQKLIRYAKYFLVPMKIAKDHKNYNKVLAWQQFYGLILAFYFRMFHVQDVPEIVVLTFIYKPKKSFVGKVYDKFMRYIVTSGYIRYFVVFSESEKKRYADYFDVPEARFVFETLGYEDKTQEVPTCSSDNFYLAAGRSNRDGRDRQAGSAPRWGYPACRSRNWSSRPVCISDTPQHPFAADHDPPADPEYVDTWYLPQRLYLR